MSRSLSGLECKYYRALEKLYGAPKVRHQREWAEARGEKYDRKDFGMIRWLERPMNETPEIGKHLKGVEVYDWIKPEDRSRFGRVLLSEGSGSISFEKASNTTRI